ncbi:MAG: response regulator, partial [Clostridiales bacterium]
MKLLGKTILLVEDEAITALTEKRWLKGEGFDVIHVTSGSSAIDAVQKDPESIDLILMDIDLGYGMDGTEAAREILKNHDIPLLFLSSHTEKEIVDRTEEITSYGYVVKGSDETVLLASMKMAFKLSESKREAQLQETKYSRLAEKLAITLQSICDGLIATDVQGCITQMNPVAENLCGWNLKEAMGKPLPEVFHIINEKTRRPVENPVNLVLASGKRVGLANHTVLVSKDGK